MKKNSNRNLPVAHLANEFALKSKVDFNNAREWLIFLYLVAQLDPLGQDELPPKAIIPVSELKKVLQEGNKHWGGLYNEIRKATDRMASVVCRFDTDISVGGIPLAKSIPVFAEIGPEKTKDGGVYISFEFNHKMKPLLLGFRSNFLGIKPPKGIASGHAIRFLIYVKAERDRRRKKDGKTMVIRFQIKEFKRILNIEGKYKQIKDLKRRVIEPIIEGVNKSSILEIVDVRYEKTGRKITSILFSIEDVFDISTLSKEAISKNTSLNTLPTKKELEQLTKAQHAAYKFMIEKKVYDGIAYREIVLKMPSSECFGYEDEFLKLAWGEFEKRTKKLKEVNKAGAFVKWYKNDVFKEGLFPEVIEKLCKNKKRKTEQERSNRELAKEMPEKDFEKIYYEQIKAKKNKATKESSATVLTQNTKRKKAGIQSLGDLIGKNPSS